MIRHIEEERQANIVRRLFGADTTVSGFLPGEHPGGLCVVLDGQVALCARSLADLIRAGQVRARQVGTHISDTPTPPYRWVLPDKDILQLPTPSLPELHKYKL